MTWWKVKGRLCGGGRNSEAVKTLIAIVGNQQQPLSVTEVARLERGFIRAEILFLQAAFPVDDTSHNCLTIRVFQNLDDWEVEEILTAVDVIECSGLRKLYHDENFVDDEEYTDDNGIFNAGEGVVMVRATEAPQLGPVETMTSSMLHLANEVTAIAAVHNADTKKFLWLDQIELGHNPMWDEDVHREILNPERISQSQRSIRLLKMPKSERRYPSYEARK
ncbi:hypothetical protein QBC36DRAFT_360664 [Triangularia setosa]|uniref:Uncharacterized protein n=1 Tax=Triangularia setosa TaxID=2587417 RepID=A0AAN7A3X7_9PEZI|nr:hypothetical protein QBC36DRAFT_360664 [Podospora setosa]